MFYNKIKPYYIINIVDNSENISLTVYDKDDVDVYRDRYISCDAWSVIYHDNNGYTVLEDIGPSGSSGPIKQYSFNFRKAEQENGIKQRLLRIKNRISYKDRKSTI